jgi:uncharacterized protein (TIGR00255 family)
MLKSMTGFGQAVIQGKSLHLSVEIRSLNHRFFKLQFKAPAHLIHREPEVEKLLKKSILRGSVFLSLHLRSMDPSSLVHINEALLKAYRDTFERLEVPTEGIITLPGILDHEPNSTLNDDDWAMVLEGVAQATQALVRMREAEGRALKATLIDMVDTLDGIRQDISTQAPLVVRDYQTKLKHRVEELLGHDATLVIDLDPIQIAREVALMADKSDITEELDRLKVHLQSLREHLNQGGEVGRTLEFLTQELHREFNTIGTKASGTEINGWVIDAKTLVEKLKEQFANIE